MGGAGAIRCRAPARAPISLLLLARLPRTITSHDYLARLPRGAGVLTPLTREDHNREPGSARTLRAHARDFEISPSGRARPRRGTPLLSRRARDSSDMHFAG